MKILVYGLNYSPELTGIGKYSGSLGEWLADRGHQVHAVTTQPYYPEWKVSKSFRRWWTREAGPTKNGDHRIYRSPIYVPERPRTFTRIVHLLSFALTSLPWLFGQRSWRPDVILVVVPTLFTAPMALLFSRLSGAKCVLHVQDFELDALIGLGMLKKGLLPRLAERTERILLRRFDRVSTISHSMVQRALEKGVEPSRTLLFPNWADIRNIQPDMDASSLREEWGLGQRERVILYSGNIGKKQGLEMVLEVAARLKHRADTVFIIVGTGAHVGILSQQAREMGLENLRFEPLQPWSKVPRMLALADIHLVVQKAGVADAVLPSKLTNILAAGGTAIVTAESDTELGLLADREPGIYQRVDPENADALQAAIEEVLDGSSIGKVNRTARAYAERELSEQVLLRRFEEAMQNLVSTRGEDA